jgi:hypothetical protein
VCAPPGSCAAPIESAWAQQRRIEDVRSIGRGQDNDPGRWVKPVHLREDLVQRLLAFVAAASTRHAGRAGAPNRIELVDEHDRRRSLLRLREEIADARRADADDRFDEL